MLRLLVAASLLAASAAAGKKRYDVLFLIVDDLRPDLGPYVPDTPTVRRPH